MFSPKANALVALLGGFLASFLTFAITSYSNAALKSQLVAGDPADHSNLPSTLNTFRNAMNGNDPLINNLHSYTWWAMVVIVGFIAAAIIFKLLRRHV